MDGFAWATIWPPTCLILCITIVYSVIQPIITVLAWLAFLLLFAAYKYVLYWCADQPDHLETVVDSTSRHSGPSLSVSTWKKSASPVYSSSLPMIMETEPNPVSHVVPL
jgi:hypothetical protein